MKKFMKSTRNLMFVVVAFAMIFMTACAGFMQLKPEAIAKLDQFGSWASSWVQGAKQQLPMILTVASLIPGAQPYVKVAITAVQDADAVLSAYDASVQAVRNGTSTPEEAARKQADILAAIEKIKTTVGQIQTQIKGKG